MTIEGMKDYHRGVVRVGFFFFSSRRRHTRFTSDWSSDVCSSDLLELCGWRHMKMGQEASCYGEKYGGEFAGPGFPGTLAHMSAGVAG